MNSRSQEVLRALVNVLRMADGTPLDVAAIHFKIDLLVSTPHASLNELSVALRFAETHGWIAGTTTEVGTQLWAITSKGRLAEI